MPWVYYEGVPLTDDRAVQVRYFVAPYLSFLAGEEGWTLASRVALNLAPGGAGYRPDFSSGTVVLTAIRIRWARIGATDPGNLICSIYRNVPGFGIVGGAFNVIGLTPDGSATVPLSSLPLVDYLAPVFGQQLPIAANYVGAPPIEVALDTPVSFISTDNITIHFYLDTGLGPSANIVAIPYAAQGFGLSTSSTFDWAPTINHQWSSNTGWTFFGGGFTQSMGLLVDLFFGPFTRARSYAQVIG